MCFTSGLNFENFSRDQISQLFDNCTNFQYSILKKYVFFSVYDQLFLSFFLVIGCELCMTMIKVLGAIKK